MYPAIEMLVFWPLGQSHPADLRILGNLHCIHWFIMILHKTCYVLMVWSEHFPKYSHFAEVRRERFGAIRCVSRQLELQKEFPSWETMTGWWWMVAMNFIFPLILGCDYHPNWRTHIFQRGSPTTNQTWFYHEEWYNFTGDFHHQLGDDVAWFHRMWNTYVFPWDEWTMNFDDEKWMKTLGLNGDSTVGKVVG